jgi:hypothetical protein
VRRTPRLIWTANCGLEAAKHFQCDCFQQHRLLDLASNQLMFVQALTTQLTPEFAKTGL